MTISLKECQLMDSQDTLAGLRDLFDIPENIVYLDGNSLGVLPKATLNRVTDVVKNEWGQGLIRSWNSAGWFASPQRVGNKIAKLVGAYENELVATDSTSINLYKVLFAAIQKAKTSPYSAQHRYVLSEKSNFPTDLYIAQSLCAQFGLELKLVHWNDVQAHLNSEVAVLMLTHVNYRTGAMYDMASMTEKAHSVGALAVWDLAHSAGAVPVDLNAAKADYAVGCGYKYLNGGPGAPAFVWVNSSHASEVHQPLAGWWGHAAPFQFTTQYEPAAGVSRYLCGTQAIINMSALEVGLEAFEAAQALGGMNALRKKSLALTDLFIQLVNERCAGFALGIATPLEHSKRGSQVCLSRETGAYAIVQALIARGVIGDFRAGGASTGEPDILRFGFTPLYIGFVDVWNAVEQLKQVLETNEWQAEQFKQAHAVT